MANDDGIDVSLRISYPGGWLECEDVDNGYELHAEAFNQAQGTHRKTEVQNRWVEGEFAVSSVRGNTTEALAVWVTGSTMYNYRSKMILLKSCFDQVQYTVIRQIGNAIEYWDCEVSDYVEESEQAFIHRTMGVLRVQLNRRPQTILKMLQSAVLPSEWWTTLVIGAELGELPVGEPAYGTPARPYYVDGVRP